MSLTLEDLKKLELPVKVVYKGESEEFIITAFNNSYALISRNGCDTYINIGSLLNLKLAPRTKIVDREYWVNVYPNYTPCCYRTKELADEGASSDRLFCKHIKMKYEVDADTGAFIKEIE